MKNSRFTNIHIIAILKQHENDAKTDHYFHEIGISQTAIYNLKAKYGLMSSSQLKRIREQKQKNALLKKMLSKNGPTLQNWTFQ